VWRPNDAFLTERRSLHDAETVLFVHHGQAQVRQVHRLLDQRMCAYQDLCFAGAGHLAHPRLLRLGHTADEQRTTRRMRALEHRRQRLVVLFGQDGRRSHDGRLSPSAHRRQDGGRRHDRLAGAHVSLQQPAHGHGLGHVGQNLVDGATLCARQGEGQAGDKGLEILRWQGQRFRGPAVPLAALAQHTKLQQQELVKGEASAGTGQRLGVVGKVDLHERLAEPDEPLRLDKVSREWIHHSPGKGV